MFDGFRKKLLKLDWLLLAAILLLVSFGLLEIYSIALGQGGVSFTYFSKQVWAILASLIVFGVLLTLDYRLFKNLSGYLYILGVLLLLAVLVFGSSINGTKGWFNFAGMSLQPVEFVKVILIIFLARMFSNSNFRTRPVKYFLLSGLSTFFLAGLVLLQPDFGSALTLVAIWIFILIFAGFRRKYFVVIFVGALLIFTVAWFLLFKDYQKERVLTFINPTYQSLDQGYNISQAMIAVGSGGFFGRGVGFGSQSQLKFLPEAHTDFIFSVVSEELGFFGVGLFLLFYALFFLRALAALPKINDDFAIFTVLGGVGLIFIEMFINIGMNIGIMPVVGIALPFVSYGGSSILASFIIVGLIENIIVKSKS